MKKAKILYIIKQADFGGGETHLRFLIDNLKKDYEPVVVSLTEGYLSRYLTESGVIFYKLKSGKINYLTNIIILIQIIKDEKINLIHSHGTRGTALILIPAIILRKRFIYTVHAWSFHSKLNPIVNFFRKFIERIICCFASKVILVSKSDLQAGSFVEESKKIFIPNIIDSKRFTPSRNLAFRESLGCTENDFVIGFIGRFTEQKNPFFALELIKKLNSLNHQSNKNFKMLMVGDGELKSLILEKIEKDNLNNFVKVLPFTPEPEKVYNSIDCVIIPSFWEGQPYVLLEAMSCGIPVIASDIPNFKEIIINAENGYCENIKNVNDFVKRILQLANDENIYNRMRNESIKTAKFYQNQESVIKKIKNLYEEILSHDRN